MYTWYVIGPVFYTWSVICPFFYTWSVNLGSDGIVISAKNYTWSVICPFFYTWSVNLGSDGIVISAKNYTWSVICTFFIRDAWICCPSWSRFDRKSYGIRNWKVAWTRFRKRTREHSYTESNSLGFPLCPISRRNLLYPWLLSTSIATFEGGLWDVLSAKKEKPCIISL